MKIKNVFIVLASAVLLFSCSSVPAVQNAASAQEPVVEAAAEPVIELVVTDVENPAVQEPLTVPESVPNEELSSLEPNLNEEELFAGVWWVSAMMFDGVYQTLAVTEINLEKSDGGWLINGNSGVNYFSGELMMGDGYIYASDNFMMTKMAGPYELMDFEDKFMEVLLDADSWSWDGSVLRLYCANVNGMVEFTRSK